MLLLLLLPAVHSRISRRHAEGNIVRQDIQCFMHLHQEAAGDEAGPEAFVESRNVSATRTGGSAAPFARKPDWSIVRAKFPDVDTWQTWADLSKSVDRSNMVLLGSGSFGRVYSVKLKGKEGKFAMKEVTWQKAKGAPAEFAVQEDCSKSSDFVMPIVHKAIEFNSDGWPTFVRVIMPQLDDELIEV